MARTTVKLTSSSDETEVSKLLSNDAIFEIPFFQRPYKWLPARVNQLNADILTMIDELSDVHFLGAIIVHGKPSNPADPRAYEVIDGQQRLTTLYLHVCAAIKTLVDRGEADEAESLFRKYLVTSVTKKGKSNLTLHPCKEDRTDLNAVIYELLDNKGFRERLQGFTFHPLTGTDTKKGRISQNFSLIKRFYREQYAEAGIERVRDVYATLLQRISVVQIDVQDPTNGPKIFDSLNSRQEPMTVGDLVRNDVFSRVASDDPELASELDEHYWQPFYRKFSFNSPNPKNYFDDYFFPFALIDNHNLRKSQAYADLRQRWDGADPEKVIKELAKYQDSFLDLVRGTNFCNHPKETAVRFQRLSRLGAPSSTYPFLMRLSKALQEEEILVDQGEAVLDVVDSFLTRRAVCGHEPTGLHAVFKSLWSDCGGNVSPANVTAAAVIDRISSRKTVSWPKNGDVEECIESRSIYGSNIAKYLIVEYDRSLGGDTVLNEPWIEHVLPVHRSSEWTQFTKDEHESKRDLFANLIPLSSEMNIDLSDAAYAVKRPVYLSDSMYKSAREFAKQHASWTPQSLTERGKTLAAWFIERWPHESVEQGD